MPKLDLEHSNVQLKSDIKPVTRLASSILDSYSAIPPLTKSPYIPHTTNITFEEVPSGKSSGSHIFNYDVKATIMGLDIKVDSFQVQVHQDHHAHHWIGGSEVYLQAGKKWAELEFVLLVNQEDILTGKFPAVQFNPGKYLHIQSDTMHLDFMAGIIYAGTSLPYNGQHVKVQVKAMGIGS